MTNRCTPDDVIRSGRPASDLAAPCRLSERHPSPGTAPALPHRVVEHRSLLRRLGEEEMWLQRNKMHNLRAPVT